MQDHLINPALLDIAKRANSGRLKQAFIPGNDPSMAAGADPAAAGGAPPGGDPSGGGAPPPGGDPGAAGGAPPAPPPPPPPDIQSMVHQAVQAAMAQNGGGGGMGGGVEPIKPKIDVNVTLLQVLKILAKIADALGIKIPASEMVATSNDLTQFAQQQAGGGAGGGGAISGIQPMGGIQPAGMPGKAASDRLGENGHAFDPDGLSGLSNLTDRASADRKSVV